MDYFDSHGQAKEYSAKASDLMVRYNITPSPRNFRIWYDYVSGRNLQLRTALDILISNKRDITEQVCDEIYEQFFTPRREADQVREISAKMQQNLTQAIALIGEAGSNSLQFGEALVGFSGEAHKVGGPAGLQGVIAKILNETKEIAQRNAALEQRLNTSADEISQLRTSLEEIRREASLDPLTGIANRKSFDLGLSDAATAALETGHDMCLLMVDIDLFKKFNDTWGHQVGDQVLKLVAKTLKDNTKGQDVAARYGGEEFGVVLPNTSLKQAVTVGNNIREALMAKQLVKKSTGEDMGRVTASIGAAQFELGEPLANLVRRADEALFAAKREGRNRVVAQDALDSVVSISPLKAP